MKRASRIVFAVIVVVVGIAAAGVAILKTLDFNQYRDFVAEKAFEATGRKLVIAGDLDLAISFSPALRLEGVTLANAEWGSRPEMVKLGRLEAEVELIPLLSGEVRITRILLSGLDVLVETDAAGKGNWQFGKAVQAGPADKGDGGLPIVPVVEEVVVENAKVTYRDGITGVSREVVVDRLVAGTKGPQSPIDLDGNGRVAGAPFRFDGQVGNLATVAAGDSFPFVVKATAFAADLSAEGVVGKPLEGTDIDVKLALKAPDPAETMKALAAVVPGLAGAAAPSEAVAVSGHARQTRAGVSFTDLTASVGPSDLSGSASIDLSGARPRFTAEFLSKNLDLAALIPSAEAKSTTAPTPAAGTTAAGPQRLFSPDPLPLDGLRAVDGNLTVKIDHLVVPGGLAIDDALMTLVLDRAQLTVAPLRAKLAGGTVDGKFQLDGMQDVATVNLALLGKGIVAGDAAGQMGAADFVEGGPTDLDVLLSGRGASVREIMGSLGGHLTVEMGKGRLHSKAAEIAGGDVVTQLANILNPAADKQEYSELSCAVVRFRVEKGLATAKNGIAVETDKVNVVGAGTVNLGEETLDLAVKPEANEGIGINLSSAVAGLVRVQGSLAAPSVGIDKAGAAKAALSVGAALATGGLSVLGEALISKETKDPYPCLTALGKAPPPEAAAPASGQEKKSEASPKPAQSGTKKMLEGVGDALGNIFGGRK